MWNKHINLIDARSLSKEFCDSFGLVFCEIYFVDRLDVNSLIQPHGHYINLDPPHVLILDSYVNLNKIGVVMHELTHHLEYYGYDNYKALPQHGYNYQLAKKRVIKWCEKNISIKPDWSKCLSGTHKNDDMKAFKL